MQQEKSTTNTDAANTGAVRLPGWGVRSELNWLCMAVRAEKQPHTMYVCIHPTVVAAAQGRRRNSKQKPAA
eukprot:14492916-Alexandrium_andersonii.AAC.1